jgi:hypothetical protein
VRIAAGQRLRHLPWELVVRDGSYLAVSESAAQQPEDTMGRTVNPLSSRPLL